MSEESRPSKEAKRYIVIPVTTPDGKTVERVIFDRGVTALEAFEIIKFLGWLDHRVESE